MTDDGRGLLEAELAIRRDRDPSPFGRAVWRLVLGDADGGLQAIRNLYAELKQQQAHRSHLAALPLLAGDPSGAEAEARHELDQPSANWVRGWREFRRAILALIAQDDAAAAIETRALEEFGSGHPRLPSGPPSTVAKIPAGILGVDAERAAEGLEDYLRWHLRSARSHSDKFNSFLGVISLEAIVTLLLAHHRGLAPSVAARYRRAELPLLAVYLTEWQGRPVDRGTKLSVEADLVASPWLAANGLVLPELPGPPATGVRGGRREAKPAARAKAELDPSAVASYLRLEIEAGRGGRWQLISWALMIGDLDGARRALGEALVAARREWEQTRPASGGFLRRLWKSQDFPNQNFVREHFVLALAAGDEPAIRETSGILRAWMDAVTEDSRRHGRPMAGHPYGHAAGHLDLLADLLDPGGAAGPRAPLETILGGFPTVHTASVALVNRDGATLETALNEALEEHTRQLERKTSPPAPLYLPAIAYAAAARRLGVRVQTDPKYAAYPVPITIWNAPGSRGPMGRLPCDLMGTQLFG